MEQNKGIEKQIGCDKTGKEKNGYYKAGEILEELDSPIEATCRDTVELSEKDTNEIKSILEKINMGLTGISFVEQDFRTMGLNLFFDKERMEPLSFCKEILYKSLKNMKVIIGELEEKENLKEEILFEINENYPQEELKKWEFIKEIGTPLDYIKAYAYVLNKILNCQNPVELRAYLNIIIEAYKIGVINQLFTGWSLFEEIGIKIEEKPQLILDAFIRIKSFKRIIDFYKTIFY